MELFERSKMVGGEMEYKELSLVFIMNFVGSRNIEGRSPGRPLVHVMGGT
jgi:hypothetical protein